MLGTSDIRSGRYWLRRRQPSIGPALRHPRIDRTLPVALGISFAAPDPECPLNAACGVLQKLLARPHRPAFGACEKMNVGDLITILRTKLRKRFLVNDLGRYQIFSLQTKH
jgi:hypothetical protein